MLRTLAICIAVLLTTAGAAAAQPAPSPGASAPATHARHAKSSARSSSKASTPSSLASNQFSSEPAAKSHCPGDAVVWVNLSGSKAYHTSGNKYYGKTKKGAYMCQKEADQSGFHPAGRRSSKIAAKNKSTKTTK